MGGPQSRTGAIGIVSSQSTLSLSSMVKESTSNIHANDLIAGKSGPNSSILSSSYDSKSYMRHNRGFQKDLKSGAIDVPTKVAAYDTFRPQSEEKAPMKLKHVWTSTTQTSSPRKMLQHRRQNIPLVPGMSETGEFEIYGTSPADGRDSFLASIGSPSSEGSDRILMSPKHSVSPKLGRPLHALHVEIAMGECQLLIEDRSGLQKK